MSQKDNTPPQDARLEHDQAVTDPLANTDNAESDLTPEYVAAHADLPATPPSGGDFPHAFVRDSSGDVAVVIGDVAGHMRGVYIAALGERLRWQQRYKTSRAG